MSDANKKDVTRIAMWSGPRNISTAMMRAWENRSDTSVVDEPFYACFLTATGIQHPMQEEVLASQSSDWATVIKQELKSVLAPHETIQYQKHMTQHMVGDIDQEWFATLSHAFLIRHPQEVVASYGEKRESITADDIGFKRQKELYDLASELSDQPLPILDSKDVLNDPEAHLTELCLQLDVPFSNNMLSWPAGKRDSDGAWAPHWYQNVEKSTGFGAYREREINLSEQDQAIVDECLPYYEFMAERKIKLS